MGIRVDVKKVVYESITMEAINPEYQGISQIQIEDYLNKADAAGRGMPDDPVYTRADLISDITQSSGIYTLPMETKPETDDFIATTPNSLL